MRAFRASFLLWLHISGLWALAVAQPLFDLLARSPEFFVAHQASRADILLVVAGLIVVFPFILTAAVWLTRAAGPRVEATALGAVLAVLLSMLTMQIVKQAGIATWTVAVPIAVTVGVAGAVACHRLAAVRAFVTLVSLAVIIVPAVFLSRPGIRAMLRSQTAGADAPSVDTADSRAKAPVVMIVFDELPLVSLLDADRTIDPVLYPHLASLARDGLWFRNATTVNDYTRWALPALLSGKYPKPGSVPTPADHPDTLFTLLGRTHHLEVQEAVTDLCPRRLCGRAGRPLAERMSGIADDLRIVFLELVLTDDLTTGLPELTGNWAGFGDESEPDATPPPADAWRARWWRARGQDKHQRAIGFIDAISADDLQPTLYFMHTLTSHHPYSRLPSGQRNATIVSLPGRRSDEWGTDEWAVTQQWQRHLLQMGFVDTLIGRLVARLKAAGLYERTLIVITADHGIAFRTGRPLRDFREDIAAEIMRVPLIFKLPGASQGGGRVSDRNVETVDVVPTIAGALGIALPWKADGVSLVDPSAPDRPSKTMFFKEASRTLRFPPGEPDPTPDLQRKLERFGGADNYYRVPRPPAFAALVGQPLSALRIEDGNGRLTVDAPWRFQNIDPHGDAVPFDVSGGVAEGARGADGQYIAVALNGTVRAVTRTWQSRPQQWLATPPLDAWRAGYNDLAVFLIDTDTAGPVLRRAYRSQPRPGDLNLISGLAERTFGVRQSGLYAHEVASGGPFRWTQGHATLVTAIDPAHPPRALRLELAMSGANGKKLTVTANGCTVFDGRVPSGRWAADLSLDPCGIKGPELTIALRSDVRQPTPQDRRRLGVGVRSVTLK